MMIRLRVFLFALSNLFLTQYLQAHSILSNNPDSVFNVASAELDNLINPDYYKIAESLNLLEESDILRILRNKGILVGEYNYNAEKLWQLHLAALCLGTHSNIALCIRRTSKFQTHIEAKELVRNEILKHISANQKIVPKWLNFNDLNVIENKKLGESNTEINGYFKSVKTRYTDDMAWCAAYVGAKLQEYDPTFKLPQNGFRAASYGGFSDSGFHFNEVTPNNKKGEGRYGALPDFTYLPNGQAARYNYCISDFRNNIPLGALVIFKRRGGGHIGFVVGTVRDEYVIEENGLKRTIVREGVVILGGNQNDAVQFAVFYDLNKIKAVTMPSSFLKSEYCPLPEIKNFYDMPEFCEQ
jgi:hypothetical protein